MACRSGTRGSAPVVATRIVSLSPPMTETLFALGAGSQLVGRSDFCLRPEAALALPRAGTTAAPVLEAVVALRPDLVITERTALAHSDGLSRISSLRELPWLTLEDVVASTRTLGVLSGHVDAAERLAQRLQAELSRPEPATGPRVLLVIAYGPRLTEIAYARPNSLHGNALAAAGARNAVSQGITGTPLLSLQAVVELDPDGVVLLAAPGSGTESELKSAWSALTTLQAVRRGHVAVLGGPDVLSTGPSILDLVKQLRAVLEGWSP